MERVGQKLQILTQLELKALQVDQITHLLYFLVEANLQRAQKQNNGTEHRGQKLTIWLQLEY